MTSSAIEPATFRFVTQHLNQWATAIPVTRVVVQKKTNYNSNSDICGQRVRIVPKYVEKYTS